MYKKQGTATNPISLDEEEETSNERELIIDAVRNKAIIQEAEFTSDPLQLCFAVAKTCIPGEVSVKQRQLNKVIKEYFKEKIGINISKEHFQPKLEPDYSDPDTLPNSCEIILYGVDFLTTKLIMDRFTIVDTQIREICWINDSNCKLVYATPTEAEIFIQDQSIKSKIEQQSIELPRGWFLLKSYMIFSFERPLWARYATSQEKNLVKQKNIDEQNKHCFQKFAAAKLELGKYLLIKFNAIDKYKILVEDIERKKMANRRSERPFHSRTRTRDKFRNQSQFDRQNEHDRRPRNHRNRQGHQQYQIRQARRVRYDHRPVRANQSFQQSNHRNPKNFEQNINTSFNYNNNIHQNRLNQSRQYLDFQRNSEHIDTDFRFNQNSRNNMSRYDLSFVQQHNPNKRKCFDAADLDSEMSFNHFGSIRKANNEGDDFNCDFNFGEKSSLFNHDQDASLIYNKRQNRAGQDNNSFRMNYKSTNKNLQNLSFNMDNKSKAKNNQNESFTINPKLNIQRKSSKDFFQQLNSIVSSVREVNEEDFNQHSFIYDKNTNQKGKNSNKFLSESFQNEDSY